MKKHKKLIKNKAKMTKLLCDAYNKAITAGGALVEEYSKPKTN